MTIPLIVLALITCVAGFIPFGHFITANGLVYDIHLETSVALLSVGVAIISILIATIFYRKETQPIPVMLATKFKGLYKSAYKRFYIDEVYQFITHKIIFACISTPIAWFDRHIVDGFMNLLSTITQSVSYSIRKFQSGRVQQYAYVFLLGIVVIIGLVLLVK